MLLPPGWRELNGKPVADIAAFQWRASNLLILEDLGKLPSGRWTTISYEKLVENPATEIQRVCEFSGIRYDEQLKNITSTSLPLSSTTVTPPDPNKWQQYEQEINRVLPMIDDVARMLRQLP